VVFASEVSFGMQKAVLMHNDIKRVPIACSVTQDIYLFICVISFQVSPKFLSRLDHPTSKRTRTSLYQLVT